MGGDFADVPERRLSTEIPGTTDEVARTIRFQPHIHDQPWADEQHQ